MSARALFPALALLAALAGCATSPVPPGTQVPAERLAASVVPGTTTRAELLATLGATKTVVFDSGYEAWLYQSPAGNGRFTEFVILLNPQGVVAKTRQGPTSTPAP
ncbi:hypothetical protein LK540_12225 [Massilia sp. IC2-278]|uniref:hypothetical protein n=1 Tax=Massilia sp. IC2-278 TaxID=2887200 RepID=UPI000E94455E|nr:hypothetical protein [Massilia sp. IC2-278]MCC2961189.1 hypothetical protein [Massilia sp. IC2-278]HBI70042.1 hypothetical protein [Massilia sp.]